MSGFELYPTCHICGAVLKATLVDWVCPNYTSHPVKLEKEAVE